MQTSKPPETEDKPGLHRVASRLYKMEPSGRYYGQIRRNGKLVRESLKTCDRKLAESKLKHFLERAQRLKEGSGKLTFGDLVDQFKETELAARDLKPRAREYREYTIEGLFRAWPELKTLAARSITRTDCERWLARRKEGVSATLLNNELGSLKMILDFALREGVIMENPSRALKRVKSMRKELVIPTREQFAILIPKMRDEVSPIAADFTELLAYSGMRRNEAASLIWGDVDFERGRFTVTGGEQGTKNRQVRRVPLFPPLRRLLERIQLERGDGVSPSDKIMPIQQCRDSIKQGCKKAKLPHFSHHSMRHFFTSNAIEQGIDFKVIAEWLGHLDGGILVASTYGHLRQQHSEAMAQKMTFDATPLPENIVSFQKVSGG